MVFHSQQPGLFSVLVIIFMHFVAKYFSMQQSPAQINVKCLKFEVPKIKVSYQYIMTALKARSSILAHFSSLHI